ncbi:ribonuclease inhibitor [Joostella sp.]|uniref:ribonuclease inhibitor n=1 Tax=Joostella sp. TaxID=2231138 RepID=UPI003A90FF2A
MSKQFTIQGDNIHDIKSFYKEINRLFMSSEDWEISESLDAFNDLLYGGFGSLSSDEDIDLIWKNISKNKSDLGLETTLEFYKNKLKEPTIYNTDFIQEKITELEQGFGKTYFEIIMEIIVNQSRIHLIEK